MKKKITIFFIISHLSLLLICFILYTCNRNLKKKLLKKQKYNNIIMKENKILKNIEQILIDTLKRKHI
jgi:hypothetical protein